MTEEQEITPAEQAAWHAGIEEGRSQRQTVPAAVAVPHEKMTEEIDNVLSDHDTRLSPGAERALRWLRTWTDAPLTLATADTASPQPPMAAPADPMDWPLPCDVKVGHGTIGKGCKLRTLVTRMQVLYDMATAPQQPEVLAEPGRWVSVADALPPKNTEVVIWFKELAIPSTGQYTGLAIDPDGWNFPIENHLAPGESPNHPDGGEPTVKHWMEVCAPDTPLAAPISTAPGDAMDAAFEAVRRRLCELPRYSFLLDSRGNLRRSEDKSGNWIEFQHAHELFDPVSVDAARARAKEGGAA